MMIMSIVATAVTMVAFGVFRNTTTITNRRDVFADGRFALDQMTKQLRQAESIDVGSTATSVSFPSYMGDGTPTDIAYQVTGGAAPYTLQRSIDSGTWVDIAAQLVSDEIFTYTDHDGVTDQVTIDIELQTNTSTVEVTTDVFLRNA